MMLEGLHPNNPTCLMRLTTDESSARTMTDWIGEMFDPATSAVAAFETADGTWLLEAYFSDSPDPAAIRDVIRPIVGDRADEAVFESLSPKDWVKASLDGLKPVRAGRFLVHGGHDRSLAKANDRSIEIEAALAFGTGHHGTTRGCLLALDAELKRRRPRHVLDIGSGTGILAFAAARALKGKVIAGDIDPEAIRAAKGNARLNGLHPWLRFYIAPGLRHEAARRPKRFDLVFANILAKPLRRLAPSIGRALSGDAVLILSGLLPGDVPGILSSYGAQGLHLARRFDLEGWVALMLRKGGASPSPRR